FLNQRTSFGWSSSVSIGRRCASGSTRRGIARRKFLRSEGPREEIWNSEETFGRSFFGRRVRFGLELFFDPSAIRGHKLFMLLRIRERQIRSKQAIDQSAFLLLRMEQTSKGR